MSYQYDEDGYEDFYIPDKEETKSTLIFFTICLIWFGIVAYFFYNMGMDMINKSKTESETVIETTINTDY